MNVLARWYDLDRNRRIEFLVDYTVTDGSLDVIDVRAVEVLLYRDSDVTNIRQVVSVQTEPGRELLLNQLFDSGEAFNLPLSLARKHGLLAPTD